MKPLLLLIITLHLALGVPIIQISCPNNCTCLKLNDLNSTIKAKCFSYDFLNNLTNKQISTIIDLSINDVKLIQIHPKLKYLKNLQYLDLSNNNINSLKKFPNLIYLKKLNLSGNLLNKIQLNELPKNLESFDISSNLINYIPKGWNDLKKLKFLQLHDNPIDCNCDILLIYKNLISSGISIPTTVKCNSPNNFHGKNLNSLNCSLITDNLLNSMIADSPTDVNLNAFYDDNNEQIDNDNEEFITASVDNKINKRNNNEDELDEGSGFGEGSGFLDYTTIPTIIDDNFTESVPKACHINCSTAKPVGIDDEENASPLPPLKEQIHIILDDINLSRHSNDNKSIEATTQQITTTTTSTTTTIKEKEVEEPEIVKETDKSLVETVPTNDTVIGVRERTSVANSGSYYFIYIIIGLVLTVIVIFIVYKLNRKSPNRNGQNRNKSIGDNGVGGEELKLLGKPPINHQNKLPTTQQQQQQPENVPLLNGQNGTKITDNDDKIGGGGGDGENDDVELRKNIDKELLLTPQLERVTIKASEIPDSIPRTPMLVQRHLNGDGEIITTTLSK